MSTRPGIRFIPAQGQDLPRRATRRPQAPRQPNPRPARNGRQNRDRPLCGESHGCPMPALRLRERFRRYPEGVDRGGQNRRMRGWAARSASVILAAFGVSISRMSVWRDVRQEGRNARRKQGGGADETSDGFTERLGDFARDCGVETTVSDDLDACKPAAERLGIAHRICISRAKNRARNRLDRMGGWEWGKARIWRRLTEPPFAGGLELPRLARAVRDVDATLRRLRVELSGKRRARLRPRRRGGRLMYEQRG